MARYPSGLHGDLPDIEDPRARLARMLLVIDENPIGETAPCMNPECCRPVDYLGRGDLILFCSSTCRSRVSTIRTRAHQQLDLITRTLADLKGQQDVPREALHARARKLRVWLARLPDRPSEQ